MLEHWMTTGLLGANASFQRAAREYAEEYAAMAVAAERERWIAICRDHIADKKPPHKEYEGYADGWLDACNEVMWVGEGAQRQS